MFDVLWTILLGIVGGVISSVIVSRVFMIQGEYQQQVKFIENIIRKLGMIAGYLSACRAVFEVSYDQDMRIENEMKEKGYKRHDYSCRFPKALLYCFIGPHPFGAMPLS